MSSNRFPDIQPDRRPGFAPIRPEYRYAYKANKPGAGGCVVLALVIVCLLAAMLWFSGRSVPTPGDQTMGAGAQTEIPVAAPSIEPYPQPWPTRPPTPLPDPTLLAMDYDELGQAAIDWAVHRRLIDADGAEILEVNEVHPEDAELLGVPEGHIVRGAVPDLQVLIEGTSRGEAMFVLVGLDRAYGIYGQYNSAKVERLRDRMP